MDADLSRLARELRDLFVDCGQARVSQMLAPWRVDTPVKPQARSLPMVRFLPNRLERAPVLPDLARHLHWQQTYSAEDMGPAFLERYGWTMVVGPDGPCVSDRNLAGFLVLGPAVEYPVHQHAAEEAYVVVSGTALWKIGKADWTPLSPGSVVHNPPWQEHGMRTEAWPLVLAFLWRAGAVEKSTILGG